ncbi:DUF7518 family protein [Halobacterium noricense]|uniref:DUF7518 family protein n=1 Tax=Halobacterium noricense TaxID=223182 RepID=UPI001E43961C|nr:hypothetical protein [Halobacterium noricense]UHH25806.1 hypothetical protein LT974_02450 [Halobacterium noricense]
MTDDTDVEELEQRVEELEATVRGLTEELVDASERIRTLEAELDRTPSTEELRESREGGVIEPDNDPDTGADEATKPVDGEADDNEESGLDDIIVA